MSYNDHMAQAEAWMRPVNKPTDSFFRKLKNFFHQKHAIKDPITIELLLGATEMFSFLLAIIGVWLIYIYPLTVMIGLATWGVASVIYTAFAVRHRRYMQRLQRGY